MKRFKSVFLVVLVFVGLPLMILAGMAVTARRQAAARQHQHQLNSDLYNAAKTNAVPQVEELLAKGAEASAVEFYNEPDTNFATMLQSWWNRLRGLPADSTNYGTASTAVSEALDTAAQTKFKDWRVLKLLLDHEANINNRGFMGSSLTALDWTTELQNWQVTNYLLDHGANVSITGMMDSNPFLQSVACDNLPVVTKMLDKGANVNFVPKDTGENALCIAVVHENPAMIRLLLKRGADINLPNAQGQTPLHRCQGSAKELETATLLLESGADPNRTDKDGNTPLMKAVNGYLEMTRLYLAHKADTTIHNKQGQTALDIAQSHKEAEIVAVLKQAGAAR